MSHTFLFPHNLLQRDLYGYAKSISDTKTHRTATAHSKSTIAHSLGMVLLAVTHTRRNTLMLTSTDPLCVKVYSDSLTNHHFVVGLEQFFGKDWIHLISDEYNIIPQVPWEYYAVHEYFKMKVLEHAQAMNKARSGAERYGRICIMQTRLPQTTKILQTSSVMWKSSRMCGVKLEVFHDPNLSHVSGEWTAFDVDVGSLFARLIGTDVAIYSGNRRSRL